MGVDVVCHVVHSSTRSARRTSRTATGWPQNRSPQPPTWPGVRQIVFLGGLGDDREDFIGASAQRGGDRQAWPSGRVPVTIVRSAVVVGGGSAAIETIVAFVDRLPAIDLPPMGDDEDATDRARRCRAASRRGGGLDEGPRRSVRCGRARGDDVSGDDRAVARLCGRRSLSVEVPFLTPRLSSLWLHLVTPVKASVARPFG